MQKLKIEGKKRISVIAILAILVSLFVLILPGKIFANSVEYIGGAEQLIVAPEDFFLNFGELLPGDTEEGVAQIKNTTKDEIEVFFRTEPLEKSEYYDDIDYSLLEKITLEIKLKKSWKNEEKILYRGNLGAESMKEFISLGKYQKGYNGEFIFKIEVPTELRNEYTLSRTKVKWIFAVEKKEETKPGETKPEETKPGETKPGETNPGETNPGETKPGETNPGETKPEETKPGETKPGETKPEETKPGETNPGTTKPTETKPTTKPSGVIGNLQTGDNIYFIIGILVLVIIVNLIIIIFILKSIKQKKQSENTEEKN